MTSIPTLATPYAKGTPAHGYVGEGSETVRKAHEEIRRRIASNFSRLAVREERIKQIQEQRKAGRDAMAAHLAEATKEFDGLLQNSSSSEAYAARAMFDAHKHSSEVAQRDAATAAEDLADTVEEIVRRAPVPGVAPGDAAAEMRQWFYAPAHRASLSSNFPRDPNAPTVVDADTIVDIDLHRLDRLVTAPSRRAPEIIN